MPTYLDLIEDLLWIGVWDEQGRFHWELLGFLDLVDESDVPPFLRDDLKSLQTRRY